VRQEQEIEQKLRSIANHFRWIETALLSEGFRSEADPSERIENYGLQFFLARYSHVPLQAVQIVICALPEEPIHVEVTALKMVFRTLEKVVAEWSISEVELLSEDFKVKLSGTILSARKIASELMPSPQSTIIPS
jgi:hypothetical protein